MYQKMTTQRKLSLISGVALLLLGLLPNYLGGISTVFAEGEVTPTVEPTAENVVDEPAEESAGAETEPVPTMEATKEPAGAETTGSAEEPQSSEEPAVEPLVSEDSALDQEAVMEVVADAAEKDVVLADESGEPLDLASQASAELLTEIADPWFEDGGVVYGYSATASCVPGGGCVLQQPDQSNPGSDRGRTLRRDYLH